MAQIHCWRRELSLYLQFFMCLNQHCVFWRWTVFFSDQELYLVFKKEVRPNGYVLENQCYLSMQQYFLTKLAACLNVQTSSNLKVKSQSFGSKELCKTSCKLHMQRQNYIVGHNLPIQLNG